jgi:hypothetical protein
MRMGSLITVYKYGITKSLTIKALLQMNHQPTLSHLSSLRLTSRATLLID